MGSTIGPSSESLPSSDQAYSTSDGGSVTEFDVACIDGWNLDGNPHLAFVRTLENPSIGVLGTPSSFCQFTFSGTNGSAEYRFRWVGGRPSWIGAKEGVGGSVAYNANAVLAADGTLSPVAPVG